MTLQNGGAWIQNSSLSTISGTLVNNGTVTINASRTLTNNGTIKGNGSIVNNGTITNGATGRYEPGNSVGTMNVTGPFATSASTYGCEIDAAAGTFDVLAISGAANLTNGKLTVTWLTQPTANATYTVMTFGSVTGTFATVTIPPVAGYTFTTTYTATQVRIVAGLVLPVELVSFTARETNGAVVLDWETASEHNNRGFEVQRSTDALRWDVLHFENGNGTSSEAHEYAFTDEKPLEGVNYYRLQQLDFDGRFEYSKIIGLNDVGKSAPTGTFYPNPARSGLVSLDYYANEEGELSVSVFDQTGRLIFHQNQPVEAEQNLLQFDFSALTAGTYSVLLNDGKSRVNRILVME
jgi:hypothetical protein